jgi:hypothetical protein
MKLDISVLFLALLAMTGVTADGPVRALFSCIIRHRCFRLFHNNIIIILCSATSDPLLMGGDDMGLKAID